MRKIIFLILFVNVYINSFAQSGTENMLKYWHYRNRLNYFVIPGTRQGESEIISQRNDFTEDVGLHPDPFHKISSNGQHGVYFGYYLSMLATEYKLLSDNGQTNEAANTLHEINLALNQFANYMDRCENYWGYPDVEDGFFVSENMPSNPCNFLDTIASNGHTTNGERHLDLLNKNLTLANNVWNSTTNTFGLPAGHPGYTDFIDSRTCYDGETTKKAMTQDEVIGVLQGLAFVRRYCPINSWEYSKSKSIACNIITFVRNEYEDNGVIPIRWLIFEPDGIPVHNPNNSWIWWALGPGDARRYAFGFIKAANYFDNTCNNNYADPEAGLDEANWEPIGLHHSGVVWNNSMSATLAAIGKSWHVGITINLGCCWNWCPSWLPCVHIPAYIPATGWGIKNVTSYYNSETFYLMIYEALHNKSTTYMSQSKALTQINSAPCEGPYNYGNGNRPTDDIWGGWSGSYRWRDIITEQQGCCDPNGNYNGLDFMIFYNLYQIIYGGISYENYNDRYLLGNVNTPQNLVAFNSITSTQIIDSQTLPWVNYKAGEQIELKPGFHAQEGSTFHAYIEPVGCGENFITDTIPQPTTFESTSEDTCITVNLPAMPCGYDTLHFNGIDGDTLDQYTYIWNFGTSANPQFSNIKNPSVYYANPGTYQIIISLTDTATQTGYRLCMNIVKPPCTDIPDTSGTPIEKRINNNASNQEFFNSNGNYKINVFPNPTLGILYVTCSDKNISFSVEISDILKNRLYLKDNFSGNTQFDLSSNPKGIYFVKVITSDGNIFVSKVVNQ
ncbi:MAG: T9SS type A sorting domain-containing protein [Bacteroidia bacterium]|nr:T9SS type A sorting domain-containing protein [Bacteroidia bacterium]